MRPEYADIPVLVITRHLLHRFIPGASVAGQIWSQYNLVQNLRENALMYRNVVPKFQPFRPDLSQRHRPAAK
jgi:hypothetical protein